MVIKLIFITKPVWNLFIGNCEIFSSMKVVCYKLGYNVHHYYKLIRVICKDLLYVVGENKGILIRSEANARFINILIPLDTFRFWIVILILFCKQKHKLIKYFKLSTDNHFQNSLLQKRLLFHHIFKLINYTLQKWKLNIRGFTKNNQIF